MPEDKDPPLHEPFAVQEILLDGFFDDARIQNGSFRCTAFSMQSAPGPEKSTHPVAVVRWVMSTRTARHFCEIITEVLAESQAKARTTTHKRRQV